MSMVERVARREAAFARIVAARKKHVDAVATYNARLALVNSERSRGNWSMRVDVEADAMWDAQSEFWRAAQEGADAALSEEEDHK